jgi:hypothetical protein
MKQSLMSIVCAGLVAGSVFAGPNGAYRNQQQRIAQGVKSGQLTPGETANLENKERAVNGQVRADRQANGGHLSGGERAQIGAEHRGLSGQIYTDKHNNVRDHFGNSEVGRREENQQDRIAQGIKSGRLNANETTNLENREVGIQREIRADRSVNGGRLTPGERRQVNQQQNQISRNIYRDKH